MIDRGERGHRDGNIVSVIARRIVVLRMCMEIDRDRIDLDYLLTLYKLYSTGIQICSLSGYEASANN